MQLRTPARGVLQRLGLALAARDSDDGAFSDDLHLGGVAARTLTSVA